MRHEHVDEERAARTTPAIPARTTEPVAEATRADAMRWLARFEPLLEDPGRLSAAECRRRLKLARELRADGPRLAERLASIEGPEERMLLETLRAALAQMEGLEADLRRRLGTLAPGDPASEVDLERLRARLAEAAARREAEALFSGALQDLPERLELRLSDRNLGSALFQGVFAFGWLSFTTLHAFLMIGGFMRAFGLAALGLLGFYAIFFLVGFGMAWAALQSFSREKLVLEGRTLTLYRDFGFRTFSRSVTLGARSRARVERAALRTSGAKAQQIVLRDALGRDVRFGNGMSATDQQEAVQRINEYLAALP